MKLSKAEYRKLTREIRECFCPDEGCLFEELIVRLKPNPRLLIQFKCIDKIRDIRKLDWDTAVSQWIEQGYAEAFEVAFEEAAALYTSDNIPLSFSKIYMRTISLIQENTKKHRKNIDFKI